MHDTTDELPPLGSMDLDGADADRAWASSYVTGLVQECLQSREPWVLQADRNYQIFAYGADPTPDDDELVVNSIQNAVIAVTDIQTKEPPTVKLDPVETGEPGETYWNGPQDLGIRLGLPAQCVAAWLDPQTGDLMHPLPIDEGQADQFQAMVTAGQLKPEWVVTVNDQLVADTYQTLFDVTWQRSRIDRSIRSNLLWTNVFGWTLWLYEWDDSRKRHVMRPMSVKQVYVDPTVEDIDDAAYAVVDHVLGADQAKRLYPQVADQIEELAHVGQPSRAPEGSSYGQVFEQTFRRKVVTLRVVWLRDQPCLYPPQVAIERGLVEAREVPDAIEALSSQPPTNDIHARRLMDMVSGGAADEQEGEGTLGDDPLRGLNYDDDAGAADDDQTGTGADEGAGDAERADAGNKGVEDGGAEPGDTGDGADEGELLEGTDGGGADGDAGGVPATRPRVGPGGGAGSAAAVEPTAVAPLPAPTRVALFKPGTDEEVDPTHPDWPTYNCLRQMTLIEGLVVDDRECTYFDIPVLHNVNVPLAQRPWGIGEPYRLWKLQKADSRMLAALVEHCEYFKAPLTAISQSMHDSLVERYKSAYIKPGMTLVVEDELWNASGGKLHNVMDPPTTPPALVGMRETLKNEITELSGYSDVLQGRAQPGVESGRAIELLQTAASSMIGFKSAHTGDFVYRFAMHALHSLVWRLDPDDVAQIVSRYKPGVLAAICERARTIEWDCSVTVSSGNGTVLSRKKQDAQNDLKLNAISMETYREKAGIDHRVEEDRFKQAAEKALTMPGAMMPQPGAPGGAPAGGRTAPPPAR